MTDINTIRKPDESFAFKNTNNFIVSILINDTQVLPNSITRITIREWIFDTLPRMEIVIADDIRFVDQFPLQDNDLIKIKLTNFDDVDPVIDGEFVLQDWELLNVSPGRTGSLAVKLSGLLKCGYNIFALKNRAFSGKTSSEVIKSIATEYGFDYEERVKGSDRFNWLQCNQSNNQFIDHIRERSFVADNDLSFVYTTRNNKMVFTSLKTEVEKTDIKNAIYSTENFTYNSISENVELVREKERQEQQDLELENVIYFNNYHFRNISGFKNRQGGYGTSLNYFDYNDDKEQEIVLKSNDIYLGKYSMKEKDKVGLITKNETISGMIDTLSNPIINKHKNKQLFNNFFSSTLMIYTRPDNTINLFDVINVKVPTIEDNRDITFNEVHSGKYIVGGIVHEADKDGLYKTILVLFRNSVNLSEDIEGFDIRQSKTV
jgi:hypothetical protein